MASTCTSAMLGAPLFKHAGAALLETRAKQVVLSGPSGFLGSRVLKCILDAHLFRKNHGLDPGEVLLLSSSPGTLMSRLTSQYGRERMATVRASRVDYYRQHDIHLWQDQLGSLGMEGENAVFVNLAAIAGPVPKQPEAMRAVNYTAPMAAARACENLNFGHWIQSSTQAVKAERAGQVPYSRWKAMADFSLSRLEKLPVSVLVLGLLYCGDQRIVGQRGDTLNLVDFTLLPLTPIMGDGSAPLQPLAVSDAAERLAFLALSCPNNRPIVRSYHEEQRDASSIGRGLKVPEHRSYTLRVYDAVGPETMSILELNRRFCVLNGRTLQPVFVDYRNFERVLNVASLGNLTRQFVSLLRSEQDAERPIVGNPKAFERLLGPEAKLSTLEEAMGHTKGQRKRGFPWFDTIRWVMKNKGVIVPGAAVVVETLGVAAFGPAWNEGATWKGVRFGAAVASTITATLLSLHFGSQLAWMLS
mmetsp:Transcript_44153/g.84372  ORF Transcript_44153/g.84372 Transcript_44153/m.84372 type:complete len:473 (+) Transcript_44153:222-1640(+)